MPGLEVTEIMDTPLNYGNWVRKKILVLLATCTLGMGVLFFIPLGSVYRIIVAFLFVLLFVSFLFPFYSYIMFSQKGGKFQEKIYSLIIQSLGAEIRGKILDIGCGNGVLAVKLALQFTDAEVTGIDYWGEDWEYSKGVCEQNARTGRVEGRVHFQKGDAAALEFINETFDGATSNLTFHEVKSAKDKKEVLREALRVVKPGGSFAFVDYFFEKKYYGEASKLEEFIRDLNLSQFECKPLKERMTIPLILKHPKILGRVAIISGKKKESL
jgi:ubiquinone/menaquinone biosynthesis C-methylase UbiE